MNNNARLRKLSKNDFIAIFGKQILVFSDEASKIILYLFTFLGNNS